MEKKLKLIPPLDRPDALVSVGSGTSSESETFRRLYVQENLSVHCKCNGTAQLVKKCLDRNTAVLQGLNLKTGKGSDMYSLIRDEKTRRQAEIKKACATNGLERYEQNGAVDNAV